ncbi:MAG: tetratricopeptide repeat protein, partial [Planctomycetes bacterium]|nr:tetratricopeptide repeat protein [Planctomycetota bacterium]
LARLAQGRYASARDDLQAGVRGDPRRALLWYNLAVAHANLEQDAPAVEALQRYRELVADADADPTFLNLYAMVLENSGQLAEARAVREALCALRPDDLTAWLELTALCVATEDLDAALPAAKRAWALGPKNDVRAGVLLAEVLAQRGELLECVDVMSELMLAHPENPKLRAILAEFLYRAKHYALAETMLDRYLERVPDDVQGLTRRAGARAEQGKLKEAVLDLDRALELAPADLTSRYNRGLILMRAGRLTLALGDLAQVVAASPADLNARLFYAQTLNLLGRPHEARATVDAFLRAYPEHPQAPELRALNAGFPRLLR